MHWPTSFLCGTALVAAALVPRAHSGTTETEKHLRDEYRGKMVALRGFYPGNRLLYDSSGALIGNANSGDWIRSGFIKVKTIHSSHRRLTVETERLFLIQHDGKEFQILKDSEKRELTIEVDLDVGNLTAEQADAVLSRIFLTAHDHLADLLPGYWRPCFQAITTASSTCSFSPELLAIPSVSPFSGSDGVTAETSADQAVGSQVYHVGKGISPPRVIYHTDPEFSEHARQARYQGTVVIMLVVNQEGLPNYIRVTKPVGMGLDEAAIGAVERWRFNPALKDGQPVAVEIAVEVDFHLF